MVTTTVLARSAALSRDTHVNGWDNFVAAGDYTPEQAETLVEALMDALREEVDSVLPEGCYWSPGLSSPNLGEITGPVGVTLNEDIDTLLRDATDRVIVRFAAIETETLGSQV